MGSVLLELRTPAITWSFLESSELDTINFI